MDDMKRSIYLEVSRILKGRDACHMGLTLKEALANVVGIDCKSPFYGNTEIESLLVLVELFPEFFDLYDNCWWLASVSEVRQTTINFLLNNK